MEMTGEIKPIQGNPLGMRLAQALRAMRGALDARPPGWVGKGGNVLPPGTLPDNERLKLGTALMGQSPEEAERIAQGDYPMRTPEMSNIPQFKTGRKQPTADLLLTGADLVPLANVAHKGVGRAVQKGLEAGARKMEGTSAQRLAKEIQGTVVGGSTQANVIKPKGGDWVPESVDFMLDALRRKTPKVGDSVADAALDKWMSTTMRKYMMNDMGTMDDPVRRAHESRKTSPYSPNTGALQYDDWDKNYGTTSWGAPIATPGRRADDAEAARARVDSNDLYISDAVDRKVDPYATDTFTSSRQSYDDTGASVHEDMADVSIAPRSVGSVIEDYYALGEEPPAWLTKKSPQSVMFDSPDKFDAKGEQNLADRFDRAGLPRLVEILADELRTGKIRPDALNKVSVQSLAEKQLSRAINEPEHISKAASRDLPAFGGMEYPDGSKWVEIPADKNQLRAEGDLMGHCVGNYCQVVESGKTRILSLRDAKGLPHITIDADGNMYRIGDRTNPGTINQIMGNQNTFPKPEYMPKVVDFLRRSNPDGVSISYSVEGAPNPAEALGRAGLDIPDAENLSNSYGIVTKDEFLDRYDPFREQNLEPNLEGMSFNERGDQYISDDLGKMVREKGLAPEEVYMNKGETNRLYNMLRETRANLSGMSPEDFFKLMNRGAKDAGAANDDILDLISNRHYNTPEQNARIKQRINNALGQEVYNIEAAQARIPLSIANARWISDFEQNYGWIIPETTYTNQEQMTRTLRLLRDLENAKVAERFEESANIMETLQREGLIL
jgi:hypothetical protein